MLTKYNGECLNRHFANYFIIISCLLISSVGCSSKPQWKTLANPSAASSASDSSAEVWKAAPADQVGPGNTVKISSLDPKVNGDYRIEFNNTLKLPYEVKVSTKGLSESQLTSAIRNAYRSYFKNPSAIKVEVEKKEYYIDAQGLVKNPGVYLIQRNSSLDEVISKAGGLSDSNNPTTTARYARVSGPGGTGLVRLADYHSGRGVSLPQWQGGETVFFQTEGSNKAGEKDTIHFLGQVKNPGEYAVQPGADFYTYLVKAGGPTDRADTANVSLIRTQTDGTHALNFDMLDVSEVPQVMPGDAIILNADNASSLEKKGRIAAQIANVISAIGIVTIAAGN